MEEYLEASFPGEAGDGSSWLSFKKELNQERGLDEDGNLPGDKKDESEQGGGETPLGGGGTPRNSEGEPTRKKLKTLSQELLTDLANRVDDTMKVNPGVLISTPSTFSDTVLAGLFNDFKKTKHKPDDERLAGIFSCDADADARITGTMNKFTRYPPLDGDRFAAFAKGFDAVMRERKDTCYVFEGHCSENRAKILKTVGDLGWKSKELCVISDREATWSLGHSGTPQHKRARSHSGFGSEQYRENVHVLWKGKKNQSS